MQLKRSVLLGTAAAVTSSILIPLPASADYTAEPDKWNGHTIYLSVACHDENGGGNGNGPCVTNIGCKKHSENDFSAALASKLIWQNKGLRKKGYRVIRGSGTAKQNIYNSNKKRANLHVPLHSNGRRVFNCRVSHPWVNGSDFMYFSKKGKRCALRVYYQLKHKSPGTHDLMSYRGDLGELTKTKAVACYMEPEYHTWNRGVDWLRDYGNWYGRMANGLHYYMAEDY